MSGSAFLVARATLALAALSLLAPLSRLAAQDTAAVRLEVQLDSVRQGTRDPIIRTKNLLEDTPWLAALRQGLPVRLQYRLEIWRSRSGWLDALERQVEWTVVVRHEPVLDQFWVVRLLPPSRVVQNRYATTGGLAEALGSVYKLPIAPKTEGTYYYNASLTVETLSESDLDTFDRTLRGELTPKQGESLGDRARRLILKLAGLPKLSVAARSEEFEVR